jgi:lipopolysaccharide transport system permease protein
VNTSSISLKALAASGWKQRELLYQMIKRDVLGRYRGSALGVFWSLAHPILMLIVYTFVFSVVFTARWPGSAADSRLGFAIVLFAGMIVFGIFSECIQKASGLIVSQPNFVKKVVFPLEIMAWTTLGAALFHAGISLGVLTLLIIVVQGGLPWTAVLLPIVLLPLLCLTVGLTWFFSALGVYVRDINQMLGVAVTALMFLSPIFYPTSALPEDLRWLSAVNPIAFSIEQTRAVLIFGSLPNWRSLAIYTVIAAVIMWLGFAWFQKTRRGFADVL